MKGTEVQTLSVPGSRSVHGQQKLTSYNIIYKLTCSSCYAMLPVQSCPDLTNWCYSSLAPVELASQPCSYSCMHGHSFQLAKYSYASYMLQLATSQFRVRVICSALTHTRYSSLGSAVMIALGINAHYLEYCKHAWPGSYLPPLWNHRSGLYQKIWALYRIVQILLRLKLEHLCRCWSRYRCNTHKQTQLSTITLCACVLRVNIGNQLFSNFSITRNSCLAIH